MGYYYLIFISIKNFIIEIEDKTDDTNYNPLN